MPNIEGEMTICYEKAFTERFLPAIMQRVIVADYALPSSESGIVTRLTRKGDIFFIDEIAPFTKDTFNKLLRMSRDMRAKEYESEYRKHHNKLPGSMTTKRLRKKQRSMIARWVSRVNKTTKS